MNDKTTTICSRTLDDKASVEVKSKSLKTDVVGVEKKSNSTYILYVTKNNNKGS